MAHICISAGDSIFTRLADVDTKANRDYVRASAISLALWLADNWWRLRWEPLHDTRTPSAEWRLRHELTSGPGGTMWPPLMIYGTGAQVVLSPPFGLSVATGPLWFIEVSRVSSIDGNDFEDGLDKFFNQVVDLCSIAQDGGVLKSLLRQLRHERGDHDLAAWRRLEARLGYDPDDAPGELISNLSEMENELGEQAVEEAAVAVPGAGAQRALQDAVEASQASQVLANLEVATQVDVSTPLGSPSPWFRGEVAARKMRDLIGIPEGPILGRAFGEILRLPWDQLKAAPATARNLEYAARLKLGEATARLALQTKTSADRRFELSRMIGDFIWSETDKFGVVSRAKTERQKFQRAFAQSLLCPFSQLHRRIDLSNPTDAQIANAAKYFHVRESVVRTLLVIKGFLPRETLAERLDAY